ncbi:MAG: CubicO group peptidase (beta-lactamase class C family) [Myxococcota bacterium]|jgi:CubicO group peptidase (beta-lactamase class C family)
MAYTGAMLLLLASLTFAQDVPPLIDALPPPPPTCAPNQDPTGPWPTALLDTEAAEALNAHLFPADIDRTAKERTGVRTDGVVVVHNGTVIYEEYAEGWDANKRHLTWSASKTVMGALTGVAVHTGVLSPDDSICDHITVTNDAACAITVESLLEMSSGFDWRETYEGVSPTASSVLGMLYGEGQTNMAGFVTGHPLRATPGEDWNYSSGDSNVLSAVVGSALAESNGEFYPWTALFDRLAMRPTWERDGAGTFVGSSYLWATPRDMARFGTFLLHDGCWLGTEILPRDWVASMTTLNTAVTTAASPDDDAYGWQTWLNVPTPTATERRWPNAPSSAYAAMGHWGQSITVLPEHDMVVVRMADDRDRSYDHGTTLALAIALVETP